MARVSQLENQSLIIFISVGLITATTFAIEYPELEQVETFPDYDDNVKQFLDSCDPSELPTQDRGKLKWWFICFSEQELGNARIIPFIFSLALIPLTFAFIWKLTNYKVVGLFTILILVTSGTYNYFNTTATYEQSWTVFLLLSIWLAFRGHTFTMAITFAVAVLAKPLALVYLPMMVAMIWTLPNKRMSKGIQTCLFGILLVFILVLFATGELDTTKLFGGELAFDPDAFVSGLWSWWFYLDTAIIVAISIPLVIIKLAHLSKQHDKTAQVLLIYIIGIILTVPLIEGFTTQLNHAYRFVPLVIFGGAGLSYILWNQVMRVSKFYVKYHLN